MDKRIIELKKQIIEENINKISLLSETGIIEFTKEDKLTLLNDNNSKEDFVTSFQTDGGNIWVRALCDGIEYSHDVCFMDLEEMDYNITSVLNNLLKNK